MKPTRKESTAALRVAYHDGPPSIHFAGMPWRRGEAQEITTAQWVAMRARGDFKDFDFKPEPTQSRDPAPLED